MAMDAITLAHCRECVHLHMMQAYEATGNRAKVLHVYHQVRLLMAEELATESSPEAVALYLELLG